MLISVGTSCVGRDDNANLDRGGGEGGGASTATVGSALVTGSAGAGSNATCPLATVSLGAASIVSWQADDVVVDDLVIWFKAGTVVFSSQRQRAGGLLGGRHSSHVGMVF